jgi:UDP-N-acetylmuramate dehydrogenase
MNIQENIPLAKKTTMRIGGSARYYADILTKENLEDAWTFAHEKGLKLIPLGGGSNTIFADGTINALIVRLKNDDVSMENLIPPLPSPLPRGEGNRVHITVGAGKILAVLINELAEKNLDLSSLTGIPGTVGGAIFGNAGQGPKGTWIDSFVTQVTVFDGEWKTLSREECEFSYRESFFKRGAGTSLRQGYGRQGGERGVIWSALLKIPTKDSVKIKSNIDRLLQKRLEAQPHIKTAGSCFKAVNGVPAWKLIDAVGLRGTQIGGVQISEKHANFLLNKGGATYDDTKKMVETVRDTVSQPLDIEMRFIQEDGSILF